MKKFEALERVQHAVARPAGEGEGEGAGAGAGADGGGGGADGGEQQVLTEEQLLEVFKQTSVFTVRSALAGLEFMHGHGAHAAAGVCRRAVVLCQLCRTREPARARAFELLCVACPRHPPRADGGYGDGDDAYRSEEDWCARRRAAACLRRV